MLLHLRHFGVAWIRGDESSAALRFEMCVGWRENADAPQDAANWHEQACLHLGLKGVVRLCAVGMIVETSILLQGNEPELVAYADALLAGMLQGLCRSRPLNLIKCFLSALSPLDFDCRTIHLVHEPFRPLVCSQHLEQHSGNEHPDAPARQR